MEWIMTKEAVEQWGVTTRRVQVLCDKGQIESVTKLGDIWVMPKGATKPIDGRTKNGRKKNTEGK